MFVVWGHLQFTGSRVDPGYHPGGMWAYAPPAHLSVLVFFLLSGYVIGLSQKAPLTKATVPTYLKKRFVRLYPIYFLCLLLALAVTGPVSAATAVSHASLTQGVLSPVLRALAPSWSLTYEVVFYLLFVPLSYFRVPPLPVALAAVLAGVAAVYLFPVAGGALFASFAFGFSFWLSGLLLFQRLGQTAGPRHYAWMLSLLLLFLAVETFDAPATLFTKVGRAVLGSPLFDVTTGQPGTVFFRDFVYLPHCFVLVSLFASKAFRFRRALMALLVALPAVTFYHYYQEWTPETRAVVALPGVFYGASVLLFAFPGWFERSARAVIKKLVPTGTVSYGLYIFHFPILIALGQVTAFSGTPWTYAVRTAAFLAVAFGGAYVLEHQFQPRFKRLFGQA
jgi:peptidoglycan/LPS O-acetylase OafA/YrhL